jgi:probable rRNA maturation factor
MIEIEINREVPCRIPKLTLAKSTKVVQRILGLNKKMVVSLAVVAPKTIQRLNKTYRRKNKVTDVLSFTGSEAIKDEEDYLGEIIICYEKVKAQALAAKHSEAQEFVTLFIHGLLHLLGFDHEIDSDAVVMEKLEKKILLDLDAPRPLDS